LLQFGYNFLTAIEKAEILRYNDGTVEKSVSAA
jgi:hypothetical protein